MIIVEPPSSRSNHPQLYQAPDRQTAITKCYAGIPEMKRASVAPTPTDQTVFGRITGSRFG
jgi:hypothetical protein